MEELTKESSSRMHAKGTQNTIFQKTEQKVRQVPMYYDPKVAAQNGELRFASTPTEFKLNRW
jgi:hypothetical protein